MIASIDDKGMDYGFYDTGNSDVFLIFIKSLHKKHGKIFALFDNVKYHCSVRVKIPLEMNDPMVFTSQPKYILAFNPVEPQ